MPINHRPTAVLPAPDVVARLRNSDLFQQYQAGFQAATGLPLVLRARGSVEPPFHGSTKSNPFCALMASTSQTCAACLQLQRQVESMSAANNGEGVTMHCFAGLTESFVPVRIGREIVAYLQTGQVFLRAPTPRQVDRTLRLMAPWTAHLQEEQLRAAYLGSPVMTRTRYQAILQLLSTFAQHLSSLSNELVIKGPATEPPHIARARAFIGEHLAKDLTLGQVAQVVHVSASYFCKLFKVAVGINFTDYIARVRVERAKQLLRNPHKRVSEAAYESGFQSLSQFNRVFRRIAGEAPSEYRENDRSTLRGPGRPRLRLAA